MLEVSLSELNTETNNMSTVMPRNATGPIWSHFEDQNDGNYVRCMLCKKKTLLKVILQSNSALRKHLQRSHPEIFRKIKIDEEKTKVEKEKVAKNKNPISVKSMFEKKNKTPIHSEYQEEYDRLLIELLAANFVATNIVDSPEYHRFVEFLDKKVNIKSGRTVRRQIEKQSENILDKVK